MPTYTVYAQPGSLTREQEEQMAQVITVAHAQSTGAPRYYVQVIVEAGPSHRRFVGGKPSERQLWIRGDIRAGRTDSQLEDLLRAIMTQVSQAVGIPREDIWIDLNEIRPTAILKYETVFPPAGKEGEWFAHLPQALQEKLEAL